jgi:hypothetical protein
MAGGDHSKIGNQLVLALCDCLQFRGVFFWRSNNIPVFDRGRGVFRRLPKYTMRGIPDIISVRNGHFIGIEAKAGAGKLSKEQADFARECLRNGGDYILARSIEDVQKAGL